MALFKQRGAEFRRLGEEERRTKNWKRWGPYLAERQWATVREDYSAEGKVWDYFSHEQARSRAYRWGEDGLLGITDRQCRLCFAWAFWNERDPILKERLFGLTGLEGNHGEDVKELYFYLDSTPTHSYMKAQYKYPQLEFPYERLRKEGRSRGFADPEFELMDTGIFDDERYFDIMVEYAKRGPNDILIRATIYNRGAESAPLHVLPTVWFRNTWIWGCKHEGCTLKPSIRKLDEGSVLCDHEALDTFRFAADRGLDGISPTFLFTENETNSVKLFGSETYTPYVKDAFHEYVVNSRKDSVCSEWRGTKSAAHYRLEIPPGGRKTLRLRLFSELEAPDKLFGEEFTRVFRKRRKEADSFYEKITPSTLSEEEAAVQRQAYAGLFWTKQFYHYSVIDWLEGDSDIAKPPAQRWQGKNQDWTHLFNRDVISMPDKWEYPWFAAWDLAFHMIPFAHVDPDFSKKQLVLMLREWYMHPNGQLPAYEFDFSEVNPPVHAWACWRVYKLTAERGRRDTYFLSRVFQKLLLNFTWWVNRKDPQGRNLFAGGFLGLDNIGAFDRSRSLPGGATLAQADGTAWMAFYCSTMLAMALELADHDPSYEDLASKFFEHFVAITDAMNSFGGTGLWDDEDGFYYDQIHSKGENRPMRVRSMVGLIPLIAVEILQDEILDHLPGFTRRMDWFLDHRQDLARHISYFESIDSGSGRHLLAIPSRERLIQVLGYLLSEEEFLSPYGIRALSKFHADNPFRLTLDGKSFRVDYVPGESDSGMFGGNSNWRGPIWFPVNFLIIEALQRYHYFYGDSLRVECPTGSGNQMDLSEVSDEISRRLIALFLPDENGDRPYNASLREFRESANWKNLLQFHEYFHGDTGKGLGASHQTGWTALVAKLLENEGKRRIRQ